MCLSLAPSVPERVEALQKALQEPYEMRDAAVEPQTPCADNTNILSGVRFVALAVGDNEGKNTFLFPGYCCFVASSASFHRPQFFEPELETHAVEEAAQEVSILAESTEDQ